MKNGEWLELVSDLGDQYPSSSLTIVPKREVIREEVG